MSSIALEEWGHASARAQPGLRSGEQATLSRLSCHIRLVDGARRRIAPREDTFDSWGGRSKIEGAHRPVVDDTMNTSTPATSESIYPGWTMEVRINTMEVLFM